MISGACFYPWASLRAQLLKHPPAIQEILIWFLGLEGIGYPLQYSWASLEYWKHRVSLQCGRPGLNPWVRKIPWRKERLPTPVFWPREFHGLYSPRGHTRLLCPWDFPGKNTGVGCYFLLQGIFPTQGLNLSLLHWQVETHLGSPYRVGSCSVSFKVPVIQIPEHLPTHPKSIVPMTFWLLPFSPSWKSTTKLGVTKSGTRLSNFHFHFLYLK